MSPANRRGLSKGEMSETESPLLNVEPMCAILGGACAAFHKEGGTSAVQQPAAAKVVL